MDRYQQTVSFIREQFQRESGFIALHEPRFQGNEKQYILETIDSTFVSSVGKFVDQFELEMAEYTGAAKAVACVNGTNALHLALVLAGVEYDDEVITQDLTFIATANAISYCGAKPVFLDIDASNLGLSPDALQEWLSRNAVVRNHEGKLQSFNKITGKRIAACVPMHTFGHPCMMDEILSVCNEYGIKVIEDAAESLGSFYKGKHTGTLGYIGVLSFNGNKIITTGGGGMLLFNDPELAARAKHLSTQAKVPHAWEFNHDATGYNYRMPNLNAALGLAQLEQLDAYLKSKRILAEKYHAFFTSLGMRFLTEPEYARSNYWLNAVFLENREERNNFLTFTAEKGIMTRPVWELMHTLPMYRDVQHGDLTNALYVAERLVNIPSSVI